MSEWAPGGAQRSLVPTSDLSSCVVLFSTPPAGGAGGSELSDRARPERQRRDVSGQARAGGGWGSWCCVLGIVGYPNLNPVT